MWGAEVVRDACGRQKAGVDELLKRILLRSIDVAAVTRSMLNASRTTCKSAIRTTCGPQPLHYRPFCSKHTAPCCVAASHKGPRHRRTHVSVRMVEGHQTHRLAHSHRCALGMHASPQPQKTVSVGIGCHMGVLYNPFTPSPTPGRLSRS